MEQINAQAKGRPAQRHGRTPDEPGVADRLPPGLATPMPGEGGRADADCEHMGASAEGAHADARADRAACRKLTDADIATAPIMRGAQGHAPHCD